MTLQQLKYVVTVAECGNITEAAKQLFVSQPTVTSAIHDLEKEMQIVIFIRTNKGVILSEDGERFLGHARQVLEQVDLIEGIYKAALCGIVSALFLCGECICGCNQRV